VEEEMGIYREEVILVMEALADIRADTEEIIRILGEDDEPEAEEES
jgi:hypothetical protein